MSGAEETFEREKFIQVLLQIMSVYEGDSEQSMYNDWSNYKIILFINKLIILGYFFRNVSKSKIDV